MAEQEYPTLNEVEPSWADVQISIPVYDGPTVQTNDIAGVKWSDKVDVGVVRGTSGGKKRKRTTGAYDADATITFYKTGWKTMRKALRAKNRKLSLVVFDILIQHTPPGESGIHTVKIVGCRVIGRSGESTEGTDPEKIEIPLSIMQIEEDGDTLL
jgi:hypothetical protein